MSELFRYSYFYYLYLDINILGESLILIVYLHGRDLNLSKRNAIAKISRAAQIISSTCTDAFPQACFCAPFTSTSVFTSTMSKVSSTEQIFKDK